MRQKLILEFQLLLAGNFQRTQQRLPFYGITHGTFQLLAGNVALDQVVLDAQVYGLHGQRLVVLTGKDHHRRSEEHTSELQSLAYLVCRLLREKKKNKLLQTQEKSVIRDIESTK